MQAHGLVPKEPLQADGKLHRVTWQGDARGSANGYYVVRANSGAPSGVFGCWKRDIQETWRADGVPPSPAEQHVLDEQINAAREQRRCAQAELHALAAAEATDRWTSYQPAPAEHGYLTRKGVRPHN